MAERPGLLAARPPDAAAIAFCRYDAPVESIELVEAIRTRERVLVVPGAHFGVERHLRISFGLPEDYVTEGLERIGRVLVGSKEPGTGN
jgi:aspartate/methionine/tyrosine aminotransferase